MSQRTELRAVDPDAPPTGVQMPRSEFRRIVDTLVDGVIIIDIGGMIMRANTAIETILGYTEAELLGKNVSLLMTSQDREYHDDYLTNYHESGRAQIIGTGREVDGRHKDGTTIPIELAVSPAQINEQTMYVGLLRDISERREYEARFERNSKIMRSVNHALGNVINEGMSTREVFDSALADLLDVTESEYGFIGEIHHDEDAPYLKTHAITNIAWSHDTRKFYRENVSKGLEFRNLNTLFGVTIRSGQRVIANEPHDDARSGGLPKGHPALKTYLGVPIYSGSKLLGMAGVANRKTGYSEEFADEIKPLLNALGSLIAAHQNNVSRIKAEETLFKTQQQLKQMATKDPVTGFANRYMVVQELEMLFERSLKGGEEFLVGLPECNLDDAEMIAERTRKRVEASSYVLEDGAALDLSVSIGVASVADRPEDLGTLIRWADEAVYAAKNAGRNCISAHRRIVQFAGQSG